MPDAIYQFMLPCTDEDCQSCSDIPEAASQIPYEYFGSKSYDKCMEVNLFNATTTDPATEFSDTAPEFVPGAELFGGSHEELMGYWEVFTANSCMGPKPTDGEPTKTSSGYTLDHAMGTLSAVFVAGLSAINWS